MMTLSIIALIVATFALLVTIDNIRRFNNKIEGLNMWIKEVFRVYFPPKEEKTEEKRSFSEPPKPKEKEYWYFGIRITKMQHDMVKEFNVKHRPCMSSKRIIIGSSGIGPIMDIECEKCGEKEDITDVDTW